MFLFFLFFYAGMSIEYENGIEMLFNVFLIIFIIEMIMKLIGFGFKKYIRDPANVLDATIVLISAAEYITKEITNDKLITTTPSHNNQSALVAFRSLRLLRLFRLFQIAGMLCNCIFSF